MPTPNPNSDSSTAPSISSDNGREGEQTPVTASCAGRLRTVQSAEPIRHSMSGFSLFKMGKDQKRMEFTVATPEEYVHRFEGKRVINKILIANNGIAAVKCMRSIRRWSYELFKNERAIRFVVMVTPEDLKANADFVYKPCGPNGSWAGKRQDDYSNVKGWTDYTQCYNPEILDVLNKLHARDDGAGHACT
ncbi:PREDICTED: acetyl-CoA carboxylase-like [Priapulus caudatus]|uniref:Acetyl-CoA carboxylase-like n=1 Tax=Priapulus caudatus TaxID=37621 RepID=A0ABM1EA65_PRICU|nr:PREDICTED: acetyl-CoA carboxylase-like [Priapulus caudatus]